MEFLMDNYVWIMIICIILLMALIGYIAEKQGFGTKQNVKKENKIKKEETIEPIKEEIVDDVEELQNDDIFEEPESDEELEANEDLENEQQLEDSKEVSDEELDDNKDSEENSTEEDLFVGLDGTPNAYGNQELNIDKDFNNILDDMEDSTEDVDIELPEVDSNELEEELEEDDIWKF